MARGRPADPTRAARGTGHRRKPGEAKPVKALVPTDVAVRPVSVVDRFPPPSGLPESVWPVWRAVVEDLGGAGHMRESFTSQLVAYCEAVWLHAQASVLVRENGLLLLGVNGGWVKNPAATVQKDAAAMILRYADALGLTPASRIRLALEEVAGMSILASLNAGLDKDR